MRDMIDLFMRKEISVGIVTKNGPPRQLGSLRAMNLNEYEEHFHGRKGNFISSNESAVILN